MKTISPNRDAFARGLMELTASRRRLYYELLSTVRAFDAATTVEERTSAREAIHDAAIRLTRLDIPSADFYGT